MTHTYPAPRFRDVLFVTVLCLGASTAFAATSGKEILEAAGVEGGLVVHLGCGDGKLTALLRGNDRYLVHGLDTDAKDIEKARAHVDSLGLYGAVTAEVFDGRRLPYIDNLVNLVVADDPGHVPMDEVMRVLAPRGVLMMRKGTDPIGAKPPSGRPGQLDRSPSGWTKTVKPWPDDMDEWTHWLHGPDNNAVSKDRRVGISRSLQWTMPPLSGRHHNLLPSVSAMVSAGGRIYYIFDEAPIGVKGPAGKWSLIARDAFNGLLQWKRPIETWGWQHWSDLQFGVPMRFKGPDQLYRRLVAVDDVLYATLGFTQPVVAIDGATGKTIRTYEGTENTAAILHCDGTLFLTQNVRGESPGKNILAIDAETGKTLWQRQGYTGITSRGDELERYTDAYLTVGDEKVFFLDRDNIVALDKTTGKETWTHPRPVMEKGVFGHNRFNFAHFCTLVFHEGVLCLGQIHPKPVNLNSWQQKDVALLAIDAATGKKLWEHTGMTLAHFTPPDLFVNGGMVWTLQKETVALCGLDVRTGALKKEYPAKEMLVGHHHRCYRNKATEQYYLAGEEGIEYIDFQSGKLDIHHWLRGACGYGLMPANGLIYMPTHACGCHANAKLNGFLALSSRAEPDGDSRPPAQQRDATTENRLEKGPAYGQIGNLKPEIENPDDWPVYKHDNARSNHVQTAVPVQLSKQWDQSIGGRLTPPVIAGDKVFFAAPDRNAVYCLGASGGDQRWRFTTDGPVDTPPTCRGGRLVFGTRAGSVYALDAASGALIWRFRAAPDVSRLMAFGRLESPWPVHGSVLVERGKVYVVAGRSMHLDGGLYVYALDPATGEILQETNLDADTAPKGELKGAVLPDVLVSDGDGIYMRQMRFDADDVRNHGTGGAASVLRVNDGGLLDSSWINNNFWKCGPAQAQMLVFDGKTAFGTRGVNRLISKSCGQDIFTPGQDGYLLFAVALGAQRSADKQIDKKRRRGKGGSTAKMTWSRRVPVRIQGMVVTDAHVFLAGMPDTLDRRDPWAAFEGRQGGVLAVYSKNDGEELAEYRLDKPPVFDGLAAANGRLFLTTIDGRIVCMSGQ